MKRQSLLFIAGGLMALASCTNETSTTTNNEMSQASIDSAVNARVEEMRTQMMMENDSLINEMALYKADSMCSAMKGQAPKPRPKTTTAAKPSMGNRTSGGAVEAPKTPSGGVNDRPGSTNQGNGGVNDRPGSTNQGNGGVNDRPGSR